MSNPTVHNLCEVNNIIRRVKQHDDLEIHFRFRATPPERLALVCHSDAAFANVGVYAQLRGVILFLGESTLFFQGLHF